MTTTSVSEVDEERVGQLAERLFGGALAALELANIDLGVRLGLYKVLADDIGQGMRLLQNYLRMREQAEAPATSRFTATPYSFTRRRSISSGVLRSATSETNTP